MDFSGMCNSIFYLGKGATMTLNDIFTPIIGDRELWNYKVFGPSSFDDEPVLTVFLYFGKTKCEYKEMYNVQMLTMSVENLQVAPTAS